MMKCAVLTSRNQWFVPYAEVLVQLLPEAKLFFDHREIDGSFEIVFILAYHKIIETRYLNRHKHNIVIHESDLPEGKGWAPLFWQVLEGRNEIVFTMFEASDRVDNGAVYMKRKLKLNGFELNKELRAKQAALTIQMCQDFLEHYSLYKDPVPQKGVETFYRKRTPVDSRLDINKSIREQFNLLRTVHNEEYPAYFEIDGYKFVLKIEKDDR